MATSRDTKEVKVTTTQTGTQRGGPEQRRSQSAATLEEALEKQDKLAREGSEEASAESGATKAEVEEATNAAIEEAGAAQEARDDEVYGRTAGAEDRRIGHEDDASQGAESPSK